MASVLDLVGLGGFIIPIVCCLAAVAAVLYVPAPVKPYVVALCVLVAVASEIYGEGYHSATVEWSAKYDRMVATFNAESEKAALDAAATAHAEDAANESRLKAQIEQQAQDAEAAQALIDAQDAAIAAAPKDADAPEHPLVLDAVRGGRSK